MESECGVVERVWVLRFDGGHDCDMSGWGLVEALFRDDVWLEPDVWPASRLGWGDDGLKYRMLR